MRVGALKLFAPSAINEGKVVGCCGDTGTLVLDKRCNYTVEDLQGIAQRHIESLKNINEHQDAVGFSIAHSIRDLPDHMMFELAKH